MNNKLSASRQFEQLLNDEWEARMKADPLFATQVGDHRYDHLLPETTEAGMASWLAQLQGFQKRLAAIPRAELGMGERLNYDIFARLLEDELGIFRFHDYRFTISKSGGYHLYFPELYLNMPLNTVQEYENYISRLNGIKKYVEGTIDCMRSGLREGQAPARVTLEGVDKAIRTHIVDDPTKSQFYTPFTQFPSAVPAAEQSRLAGAGADAIRASVVAGYADLLKFFNEELYPGAREDIAAISLPGGRAYYQFCIRMHTTLDLTPEEVHETGMKEVRRIRAEMEEVIRQVGFQGDFRAFLEFLHSDPRFYVDTPDRLLEKTALTLKRIDGELPRLFKALPRLPYGIRPIPDFSAPGNTTAYYQPGAGDGTRAGYYYVNTYDLKSRPTYEIEALSLHEAVPGHHLQLALQQELDLPNFRRFRYFTAYVEGWALYAERLGLEMGFYQDPYSNFGRLSYEMWRACRLVVDTGMHALSWTRQQAIDFMAENTSSTLLNIINEVDRYIGWPGQALAYKMGELKIRQLRQRAELALGSRFDVREFHDVVLRGGSLPLSLLETAVEEWMAQ